MFKEPKKEYLENYSYKKSYRNALAMVENITDNDMNLLLTKTLQEHNVDYSIKHSDAGITYWIINPLCEDGLDVGLFIKQTPDEKAYIIWVTFTARGRYLTQVKKSLDFIFFPKDKFN